MALVKSAGGLTWTRFPSLSLWPSSCSLGASYASVKKCDPMTTMIVLGGILAALLLGYLGFALLYPEKLS